MKTKVIILATITVVMLNSCSSDRDNEVVTSEKTDNQKFKLNSKGLTAKDGNEAKADTIVVKSQNSTSGGPFKPDPTDGTGTDPDPVVDPTKPDKPW